MLLSHILCTILVILFSIINVSLGKTASVFQIIPGTDDQLQFLYNINSHLNGTIFWEEPTIINEAVDVMVPSWELPNFKYWMNTYELEYHLTISNIYELLNNAIRPVDRTKGGNQSNNFGWKRFHTLDEIYSWLDNLARIRPKEVETIVAGKSYEGRAIKGLHLKFGQNRPGVFIEAGIHAREWISHATATYLINELLNSRNPEIRQLAESFDWYIFPCVNPDGYVFTHINPRDPNYRLWRKTRSPKVVKQCSNRYNCYNKSCYGADPNRNWDFNWGGIGSSRDPCNELYAGKSAFSEIEVRTLAEYITSIAGKLFAYISFHSHLEKLMFPYGHTTAHLDNYNEQYEVARQAASALSKRYGTRYHIGNIAEVIKSPASGGSIDWVKAKFKLPYVYCYELRGRTSNGNVYKFIPPPSEIIPNGQEVMDSLVVLFRAATRKHH